MNFNANSNPSLSSQKQYNTQDGNLVRKHFDLENKVVRCNVKINKNGRVVKCGREYKYHGNTTGILRHLEVGHGITKNYSQNQENNSQRLRFRWTHSRSNSL